MDLPEDGPHLEARRLVGGHTISVETEDEVPRVTMQKPTGAEKVLVRLPILNVFQDAFGASPSPPVTKSLNKLSI